MYFWLIELKKLKKTKGGFYIRKKSAIASIVITFLFGVPFKWIKYKGVEGITVFQVKDFGALNLLYDFMTLSINFFIVYFIFSKIEDYMEKSKEKSYK
ncbi:hypothetical protein ACIQVU_20025 [Lysinibacillus sp. NPDC098008]|uniref:hypothetical protein n=1 Tax=Lysinibacillus sp. NPDC098008 TaxID=3364146 RepID=UPI003814A7DD